MCDLTVTFYTYISCFCHEDNEDNIFIPKPCFMH